MIPLKFIQFFARNRIMLYIALAAVVAAFLFGAWSGWRVKSYFQMSANMKAVERDLKTGEELDEIRNNAPDRLELIDLLRDGKY